MTLSDKVDNWMTHLWRQLLIDAGRCMSINGGVIPPLPLEGKGEFPCHPLAHYILYNIGLKVFACRPRQGRVKGNRVICPCLPLPYTYLTLTVLVYFYFHLVGSHLPIPFTPLMGNSFTFYPLDVNYSLPYNLLGILFHISSQPKTIQKIGTIVARQIKGPSCVIEV